jgi:hypothetical protein
MVGGGPVYIDRGQLFFQVVVPEGSAAARRGDTVRRLLEPAVDAFNDVGIAAELDARNEVVLGDRKICGHAGGQIERSVVVVGNVIDSFDHEAAASVVRTPSPEAREEFLRQMRRFVVPTPTDFGGFIAAASRRYAAALGLTPMEGDLDVSERRHLECLDQLFVDPDWVNGAERRAEPWWRAKVKSGVWVGHGGWNGHRLTVTFEGGGVRSLRVSAGGEPIGELGDGAVLSVEEAVQLLRERDSGLAELLSEMAARPPA